MPSEPSPVLASNAERDAAAQRLQVAFAEQRLTDEEFDQGSATRAASL